ncbi:NACHT domain- and WD repeat-containing protein 1-like [Acanthaster planci]|uniref:NACHT domain- and WD repeat-containing protein 1-like n=1 Tax=Acanthaster planci TaxID=133434 RepID=A0A8B7ZA44_ACAPL|nr:NACHT domain- and WD repeat-containing protein 1-like [Acanthaster planci]
MASISRKEADNTANSHIVLTGDFSVELPRQRSKVVRIFTSSTFTDTSVERNALMRETYPRLKDYCKSRHGLEFQVIDMRWGVRDEATDDHMTSQLCMAEIAGSNNGKPIETLDEWFRCDDNCIPPVYVLQPISSRLPYFNRQDDPEKMRAHKTEWWATFELLQGQLRFAANEVEKQGLLTADQSKKYRISVTHDEVDHGIINTPSDRQNQCLCFIRKFSDLESKYETREASKFLDLQDGKVDIEARELLSDLRDNKVTQALPLSNTIVTDLGEWTKDGVNLDNKNHSEYIKGFLDTFYTKIVSLVEIGISKEKLASLEDPLHQEILQHLSFCLSKCVGFQGRDGIIKKVKALSMEDVLADFSKAEEKVDDVEISILFGALRLSSSVISDNPDQLAPEVIGRLMDAASKFPRMESLLKQAKIAGSLSHPLLPLSTCLQPPGGMMLTSLEGHTGEVVSLAITSDSRLVVTGSKDNTARIWQIENGTLVHILTGHREAVYGIEITPDDQSCVTYTHNGEYMKSGKICVWNMETGDLIHRLKGHTGKGQSNLAITLDGKYAVSGLQTTVSHDDNNEDTDHEEDEIITDSKKRHKEEKRKELIACEYQDWDEEVYDDESRDVVVIWNLESGQIMHWLNKHTDEIKGVLTTEIAGRQVAITFSEDHTLVLWDILKGEMIREMTDADDFPILKVVLSEDRRLLAVHGYEISLHSFPDCEYLGDARDPESSSTVEAMYITKDNTRVISGHTAGVVRTYGTGNNTERTLLGRQDCFERDGELTSMAITPNERYVVAAFKTSEAVVLNPETLEVEAKLQHIQNVSTVAVTPDGSKILTGSEDKNVRIWDVTNLKTSNSRDEPELPISKHDGCTYEALTLNSDDKVITTGSDKTIKLWDVRSGKLIKSIKDPMEDTCYAVAISRDDTFMVGSSSGWYVLTLPDFVLLRKFKELWITPSHCVITPDNKRLVAGLGQPKFEIRFLHLETGQTLQIINLRSTAFRMLRHGVFINQYTIGMYDSLGKTKTLELIDSDQGRVIGELKHADQVLSIAVSPNEKSLVVGSNDNDVDLWNLTTFSKIASMKGHTGRVKTTAFSPDGNLTATGADGGEIIIWDVQSQSLKHFLRRAHESDVSIVIFSPDGRFLVSSGQDDNYIQVWDTQTGRHLMKYHTYAKTSSIIMSAKCNTAIITLQDGRVAFLTFSTSIRLSTTSKKSAPASVTGISISLNSPMTGGKQPQFRQQMLAAREIRTPNQPRESKTCQVL